MIKVIDDSVFGSNADCIVNTVNCVGVMGKGLALDFALRYPKLENMYIEQCKRKEVHTGTLYFYNIDGKKIINFPTKFHFKYPSQIEWIKSGLDYFVLQYKEWNIKSVAFPLLGARNGGIDASKIVELIKDKMKDIDIDVYICLNKKPDTIESNMLDKFRTSNIYEFENEIKLNETLVVTLKEAQKTITRMDELYNRNFVSIEKYKKICKYLLENKQTFEPLF